jgi:arylsulfatase
MLQRPSLRRGRLHFTYHQGTVRIPEGSAPFTKDRSYMITAKIDAPEGDGDGVILTPSGRFAGWELVVLHG